MKRYTNGGHAYFAECCERADAKMSHGQPLYARYPDQRYSVPVGPLGKLMGYCASCDQAATLVVIKVKARFGRQAPKCDGRCLNGKYSCDCQCGGRCHGAGECRC